MADTDPQGPRLFSVAEADALVPFLEESLARLATLRGDLRLLRKDIEVLSLISASAGAPSNPDTAELREKRRRYRAVVTDIEGLTEAVEETGCIVKQPDEGLVDFFHLRGDRLVFLCWRLGEKNVRYWHPLAGGFAARQPLEPAP